MHVSYAIPLNTVQILLYEYTTVAALHFLRAIQILFVIFQYGIQHYLQNEQSIPLVQLALFQNEYLKSDHFLPHPTITLVQNIIFL